MSAKRTAHPLDEATKKKEKLREQEESTKKKVQKAPATLIGML